MVMLSPICLALGVSLQSFSLREAVDRWTETKSFNLDFSNQEICENFNKITTIPESTEESGAHVRNCLGNSRAPFDASQCVCMCVREKGKKNELFRR
uniref:Putative secreted protein n=1 Tax=Anopheles marajoara TaxID=58244 RepID=A0A2M4C980_9DIPT